MIICDHFVFLHLHKSGGTFVNQLLLNCVPSARKGGYHLPYAQLPAEYRALPVLGTVRNPWAYYVSWYFFQRAQERPNALFRICSDEGRLGFDETVTNLATLHRNDALIDRLVATFPDDFRPAGLNLTKTCIERIRGSGLGFYSFLYQRLYAGADSPRILRVERLRTELRDALEQLTGNVSPRTEQFLTDAPDLNRSDHAPPAEHYDPALRDLVARADHGLIETYDYAL